MLLNEPTFPRWIRPLLVQSVVLPIGLLQGFGESSGGPTPNSGGTGTEMRPLFNGRDLTGWVGDEDVWSVQDGAITAQKRGPGLTRDYHLVLQDHEPGDFELRYQVRTLRMNTNQYCTAGVLIRGVNLGTSQADCYLVDNLSSNGGDTKILEPNGRGWLSRPTKTTVLPDGGVKDQLEEVAEQATIDNLKRTFIPRAASSASNLTTRKSSSENSNCSPSKREESRPQFSPT